MQARTGMACFASTLAGRAVEVVAGPAGGGGVVGRPHHHRRPRRRAVARCRAGGGGAGIDDRRGKSVRGVDARCVAQSSARSRYLGIEGPRAVTSMRHLLPRSLGHMISGEIDTLTQSPEQSLAYARTRNPSRKAASSCRVASPRSAHRAQAEAYSHEHGADVGETSGSGGDDSDGDSRGLPDPTICRTTGPLFDGPATALGARLLRKLLRGAGGKREVKLAFASAHHPGSWHAVEEFANLHRYAGVADDGAEPHDGNTVTRNGDFAAREIPRRLVLGPRNRPTRPAAACRRIRFGCPTTTAKLGRR